MKGDNTGTDPKNLKAAIWYAHQGFSVIPCKQDKKPHIAWEAFQKERAPEDQLREWWAKFPDANIGIVTGAISNLTVVDLDSAAGAASFLKHLPQGVTCPTVKTPKGQHLYFRYREGIRNRARFLPDCDIRSEGGYVLAPTSSINGNAYSWVAGKNIKDTEVPELPEDIRDIILSINAYTGAAPEDPESNNEQQIETTSNIKFDEGMRDETLFHLANHLVKGGMPQPNIYEYLRFFASHCSPPFPEKEVQSKIKSALVRSRTSEKTVAQEVREFLEVTQGNFRVTDMERWVTHGNKLHNKAILMALSREVKAGTIERLPQPGLYRILNEKFESTHIRDVKPGEWLDIRLPFGLDNHLHIASGNLICIAGVTNAGKSAVMLNIIRENMKNHKCWYFSSEMNKETAKGRIEKYQEEVDWDFEVVDGWSQSPDVIQPDDFNFLDWLDVPSDGQAYDIPKVLSRFQAKLKKGIAIVAMQKKKGNENAIGGEQTKNKASLYLTLDPEYPGTAMRVTKAKAFDEVNPNDFMIKFKIYKGINLYPEGRWEPEAIEKYKEFKEKKK